MAGQSTSMELPATQSTPQDGSSTVSFPALTSIGLSLLPSEHGTSALPPMVPPWLSGAHSAAQPTVPLFSVQSSLLAPVSLSASFFLPTLPLFSLGAPSLPAASAYSVQSSAYNASRPPAYSFPIGIHTSDAFADMELQRLLAERRMLQSQNAELRAAQAAASQPARSDAAPAGLPSATASAMPASDVRFAAAATQPTVPMPSLAYPPMVSSIQLPMFGTFDGTGGEEAIQWLADVRRFWQFSMHQHRGKEVMLTLSKLRGDAIAWYASELAPHYGHDGAYCPSIVFADAFTARYITPYLQIHAREALNTLRQGEADARTYNERFNAAIARLAELPGHEAMSMHALADRYIRGLDDALRAEVFMALPCAQATPLPILQCTAVTCDERSQALRTYSHRPSTPAPSSVETEKHAENGKRGRQDAPPSAGMYEAYNPYKLPAAAYGSLDQQERLTLAAAKRIHERERAKHAQPRIHN